MWVIDGGWTRHDYYLSEVLRKELQLLLREFTKHAQC